MNERRIDTAAVYRTVADLLPQEGRDFGIALSNKPDGSQNIDIKAITPLGKAWVPFLVARLKADDAKEPTVAAIRRKVQAEADAKLQSRIRDMEETARRKRAEADKMRDARIAADGEKSPVRADEAKALEELRTAEEEAKRLRDVAGRVKDIRTTVDARARKAAEEEVKKGRDWRVDFDAPLESLFERTDAETKLREKERIIQQMAEQVSALDRLGDAAVQVAKQYALDKNK